MTTESPILAALTDRLVIDPLFVGDGSAVTVADFLRFVDAMQTALRSAGLDPRARICAAMPNHRLLALTALAAMSIGTFAPLNPRLSEDELALLMTDLGADALVATGSTPPAARHAARRCGMCVIDVAGPAPFTVVERATKPSPEREDHALLLHTSGTTSRPKLVGLSAENLVSSASAVARTLQLSPLDTCLSVMPLFHIHGIVGVLLASVLAGSSVEIAGPHDPFAFRRQLSDPSITWTSAVPSMYQAMLSRPGDVTANRRLRLLRSSSAPLPPSVWHELEAAFACPVINAYGMTEASHQMTSNPVPPGERRLGTVGPSAGAEVAVLSDGSVSRRPDVVGEVVVRGSGVMREYLSPPSANDTAWHDGWFRTGDLGSLDRQSYLTLHGRIKEIINVGGEKVSPFEVESVVLGHPSVMDAVAFAAPDRLRGEQVCVAVVLHRGAASLEEHELRRFTADRLAAFKAPRRVIVLDQIPVGPTGKVQRSRMSSLLGLTDATS